MKRRWDPEELIDHWTLLPDELSLVGNKAGVTRLGCETSKDVGPKWDL